MTRRNQQSRRGWTLLLPRRNHPVGRVHRHGGVVAAFSPPQVAGLTLWLKADAGVYQTTGGSLATDGQTAQEWQDQSGNLYHLAQGTAGARPTFETSEINGLPVVRFNGIANSLNRGEAVSDLITAGAFTLYAVFRTDAFAGDFGLGSPQSNEALFADQLSQFGLGFKAAEPYVVGYNNDGTYDTVAQTIAAATVYGVMFRHESGNLYLKVSGFAELTTPSGNTAGITGNAIMGRSASGAIYWDGDLGELLVYNGAVSPADRTLLEDYLATRWAIAWEPFSPADIAGLTAWYKTDGTLWQDSARTTPATADTHPVGAWDDASGNNNHLLQPTSSKRGTLKTGIKNGRAVVRFDGADDVLPATFTLAQPITAFCVFYATTSARYVYTGAVGGAGTQGSVYIAAATQLRLHAGTSLLMTAGTFALSTWYVESHLLSGASSQMWLNGTSIGSGNAGTGVMGGCVLGSSSPSPGSAFLVGDVGEVILYAGALSTTDRQNIENYLKARWGIA